MGAALSLLAAAHLPAPHVDFAALSPLIAFLGGAVIVLFPGLSRKKWVREHAVPVLTLIALAAAAGLTIWQWHDGKSIIDGELRIDGLSLVLNLVLAAGGASTVLLAWRSEAGHEAGEAKAHSSPEGSPEGSRRVGELHALLLSCIGGMSVLAAAESTVMLFLGLELLSIPLYVMCASDRRREQSLEAGLKYLIIGSVGSSTLLYGLALIYGATGATGFAAISHAISANGLAGNTMLLGGMMLSIAGFCFKASVAPFHQWTPDVYEGAPTAITAFMAVATKVAALGAFLRFFDVALIEAHVNWGPVVAVLAAVSIIVGNVGALTQSSMKRMLAYSAVAHAGYMLAGVVVATSLGMKATVFYLIVYLFMNLAAFAVVIARERQTDLGDSIDALRGIGRTHPLLAWPMTLSMFGLAGIPATAGFVGKVYLIDAAVNGGWAWLGVVIVIGSMISLAYYLPVVAAMWMRAEPAPSAGERDGAHGRSGEGGLPAIAGGSPELDALGAGADGKASDGAPGTAREGFGAGASGTAGGRVRAGANGVPRAHPEVVFVAVLTGAATLFFGIVPQPLFELISHVGRGLGLL